jgi:hypothetical protein
MSLQRKAEKGFVEWLDKHKEVLQKAWEDLEKDHALASESAALIKEKCCNHNCNQGRGCPNA